MNFKEEFLTAIIDNNLPRFRQLLNQSIHMIRDNGDNGDRPLILAVKLNRPEMVKELLEYGFDRRLSHLAPERDESGLLRQSQRSARAEIDPNTISSLGKTPLTIAIEDSEIEVIQELLRGGADPNLEDGEGVRPLVLAVEEDSLEMVKLLLDAGADINLGDKLGNTPLFMATKAENQRMVRKLIEYGADRRLSHLALERDESDLLRQSQLSARAEIDPNLLVNPQDEYELDTPLFQAMFFNNESMVKDLLKGGADRRLSYLALERDKSGLLRQSQISSRSRSEMRSEIDPNLRNREGISPLEEAVDSQSYGITETLLEYGADPNLINPKTGDSPLIIAVTENDEPRIVELLLKYGANPNSTNQQGESALSIARLRGEPEIFQALINSID